MVFFKHTNKHESLYCSEMNLYAVNSEYVLCFENTFRYNTNKSP